MYYRNDHAVVKKTLNQSLPQQQSLPKANEKKIIKQKPQRSIAKKPKAPFDRLCKYCLLSTHDESKCVWFNPNIKSKRKR